LQDEEIERALKHFSLQRRCSTFGHGPRLLRSIIYVNFSR
jgi:hypothetical protein